MSKYSMVKIMAKAKYIQAEDILGLKVLGWTAEEESVETGSVCWTTKKSNVRVYGTPNWIEDGEVPFTVNKNEDEEVPVLTLFLSAEDSLKKQKSMYLALVKTIIENL